MSVFLPLESLNREQWASMKEIVAISVTYLWAGKPYNLENCEWLEASLLLPHAVSEEKAVDFNRRNC